jgi:peptidyl-prolyl cis-trans isomerase C
MTDAPVKSQFGWHIIRMDDERQAEMPKFEDVKPQITQQLQQQKSSSSKISCAKRKNPVT